MSMSMSKKYKTEAPCCTLLGYKYTMETQPVFAYTQFELDEHVISDLWIRHMPPDLKKKIKIFA
jgi:hypothetical protein